MSRIGAVFITKPTGPKHTATVIFFHGSGSSGNDMKDWVTLVADTYRFPHIKVLYPTAPSQPYTPARGYHSNVWFDRFEISPHVPEKVDTIANVKTDILSLIEKENALGIPNNRIIVGGFSMGGAIAMHTAFRWAKDLAGVFAFASFLNDNSVVYEELEQQGKDCKVPPLLQVHGEIDDLVDEPWAKATFDKLKELGVSGDYHRMENLGHSINSSGMKIITDWIQEKLPKQK